jgi:DNA-binding NtrC family response regulator
MPPVSVLISTPEIALGRRLERYLVAEGLTAAALSDPEALLRRLASKDGELTVIDAPSGDAGAALALIAALRRHRPTLPVILIARRSSEALAIAALRLGVNDYFKIPFDYPDLLTSIRRHLPPPLASHPAAADTAPAPELIGASPAMGALKSFLSKVAAADSTVLVTGETGTGKELAAALIHRQSRRRRRPLVSVNCAALPEGLVESELFGHTRGAFTGAVADRAGKFELAGGGTLFLDEIGDISLLAQAKLLRTIEFKEICPVGGRRPVSLDVRIIAATNQEPEELVAAGRFRKDLYYRINVARVHIPPLRQRREDIPTLVAHFIAGFNPRFGRRVQGLTSEALACLMVYDWPGNVRELRNLIEATFINLPPDRIDFMNLPAPFRRQMDALQAQSAATPDERRQVVSALIAADWNKSRAAQRLKWSRMTLYRKIEKYRIVQDRRPKR